MRNFLHILLAAWVSLGFGTAFADEETADLVDLSRRLIQIERKIVDKLVADAKEMDEAGLIFEAAVAGKLRTSAIHKKQLERASMAIQLGKPFANEATRQAVLLRLAAVDLAIHELSSAQLAEIRQLEADRSRAMKELIQLMKRILANQKELLAYLADPSLRKKFGQLNISLLATSIVEAKRLSATLSGQTFDLDFDAEKARIEKSLADTRQLLSKLDELGNPTFSGGNP